MPRRRRAVVRNRYMDRYRGRVSFGADASTGAYESFNTGISMSGMNPHKWDVYWFSICPAHYDDAPGAAVDLAIEFQLAFGTHTAILEPDDMQVCCGGVWEADLVTSGAASQDWPVYAGVKAPLLCLSSVLTVMLKGTNVANINATEWKYEIGYLSQPTNANEAAEFFAQVGAL